MKIYYSNGLEILDEFTYNYRLDSFRKGNLYYKFMPKCYVCGEPYFTRVSIPSKYCSKQCASKSDIVRAKISRKLKGRKITLKQRYALLKAIYKGGVVKNNIPLYDTYAIQLDGIEDIKNVDGLLYARCSFCSNWFLPSRTMVEARSQFIKGNTNSESRLYCSEECKVKCPIFNKRTNIIKIKNKNNDNYTNNDLSTWSKKVLHNANYLCEICGSKAVHAHHILPKKLYPLFALDPHNGLACCASCHNMLHKDDCSYINLAKIKC